MTTNNGRALANRLASLGELTAGITHEINNALTSVVGNLEIMAMELEELSATDARLRQLRTAVADARVGADRVRIVLRDLSVFSQLTDSQRDLVEIPQALGLALNLVSVQIKHKARLVERYEAAPPVLATTAKLAQVFVNLLLNAIQSLDADVSDHEIRLGVSTTEDGQARVVIEDTGRGFRESARGAGTGLTVCEEIVAELGGTLELTGRPAKGTRAVVLLPPAERQTQATTDDPQAPAADEARASVLVVDDEPLICRIFGRALARDHDVVTKTSAEEALELIAQGQFFDVIISDVMMPGMSGIEFYERLEQVEPLQAERMVLVTGATFLPSTRAFLERTGVPCFRKPVDVAELCRLIGRRVDARGQWKRRLLDSLDAFDV